MPPSPTHTKRYTALCRTLSERLDQVDWPSFTPAEWDALPRLAQAEGVAPLMYSKLKGESSRLGVPQKAMDALAAEYYRTAANNALLFSELERILAALDAVNIPVIVLKGAALAQTVYPDPALRPMGDLDLLVQRADLQSAAEFLRGLSYVAVKAEYMGVADWLDQAANHHIHFEGGPGGKLVVELHWNLVAGDADPRTPPNDWVWVQTAPWQKDITKQATSRNGIRSFNWAVHLLYAAAHLMFQHSANSRILIWYYDVDRLARWSGGEAEWEFLLDAACTVKWVDALYNALLETQGRFATPIPDDFLTALKSRLDPAAQRLMAYKTKRTASRTLDNWRNLSTYPLSVRLKLAWALIFPKSGYIHYRYHPQPAWMWPLYYPYRWLDMAGDVLKTLFKGAGNS